MICPYIKAVSGREEKCSSAHYCHGHYYENCRRLLAERAKEADLMGPSLFNAAEAQLDEDCTGIDYPLAKRLLRALKTSNQAVADLRREFADLRREFS